MPEFARVRVRSAVAPLLAEPRIASEQISQRVRGHVLSVVEARGDWMRVRGDDEYVGWTHQGYVTAVTGVAPVGAPVAVEWPFRPGATIMETACQAFMGTPYQWGGITPWGADCSGFVQTVFSVHGMTLPRDASQQALVGCDADGAVAGDLLFFSERADGRITHVAIALGPHGFVHVALGRGGQAVEGREAPDQYVATLVSRFRFARRVLGE
jgi:gamma-D-glutamyl-L-lysine dipeptidyl-peptidase